MPRKTKTEQEQGYMRSFWDEARTLQSDYTASVGLYSYPTDRPSVWSFRLVFTPLVESLENPVGSAAVQFMYPIGDNVSLAGYLWNRSMELSRLVSEQAGPRAPYKRKAR